MNGKFAVVILLYEPKIKLIVPSIWLRQIDGASEHYCFYSKKFETVPDFENNYSRKYLGPDVDGFYKVHVAFSSGKKYI